MADSCCQNKAEDLKEMARSQRRVLWIVLAVNGAMFLLELILGWMANSAAVVGDSLDMFGDALAYGTSLYVLDMGLSAKVKVAKFKAYSMIILGFAVLGKALYRAYSQVLPELNLMTSLGGLALVANIYCLLLLSKHKNDDINFSSVWVCSRNDIIANISILVAAGLVYLTKTSWPDIIVGLLITVLFLRSALGILKTARIEKSPANSL